MEKFKIYANYGVLGKEKRVVYSYYTPMTEINDELIVELPDNENFKLYESYMGDLMVETKWGHCYEVSDVLQGEKTPCFFAIDRDGKGHRVVLDVVEQ